VTYEWPDHDWIRVTNQIGEIVLERDYRRRPSWRGAPSATHRLNDM